LNEDNRKKQRETCLKNFGHENPFSSSEIISKIKKTNMGRFGYEYATQNPDIQKKADHTNQLRYGRKRKSQSHIPEDIIAIKNNTDTMRYWYFDLKIPVYAIAEILGVNHSQLCVHFRDNLGIDISRHRVSYPETQLFNFVKEICPDAVANDRSIIAPKELDIVIPSKKIAIEYNGLAWHSEVRGRKDMYYHINKSKLANDAGYHLIHIFSNEWEETPDIIKSRLSYKLGRSHTVYARHCAVRCISESVSKDFLSKTHIQGWHQSDVNIGLFHNNMLVSVMSFGKPRYVTEYQWELSRMSSELGMQISGGASKMFSYFLNHYGPESVISYCDIRWDTGEVYRKLGFMLLHIEDPNYWYISKNQFLHHRTEFHKHKISERLRIYDPQLTEWENMQANGYDRIWDCGNTVWAWVK
jgi:hypothetical protein